MELKGKKINFLGDSITEGCGVAKPENIFWNRLASDYGVISRGYGIGGTRIARAENDEWPDGSSCFTLRADTMDPDADAVVVFGGTNDFGHGKSALGTMDDRTDDTFYGAMHVLCQKLLAKYPAATIVFLTPTHRESEDAVINERGIRNQTNLAGYAAIIKEVCAYYSIPVLDLFAMGGIQPKVKEQKELLMPDGLHPNDAGHAVIEARLAGFLQAL